MENRDIFSRSDFGNSSPVVDHTLIEFDLTRLVITLIRGWWKIFLVMLLVGLGSYVYIKRYVDPSFTAQSTVTLENRTQQATDIASVVSGLSAEQPSLNTEIFVIRSRTLIGRVVDELDLLADPDYNPALQDKDAFSVGKLLRALAGLPLPPPLSEQQQLDAAIDNVLLAVSVKNPSQSYVFEIMARASTPEKAALIANTVSRFYSEDQLRLKEATAQQAVSYLLDRATQLQQDLGIAELEVSNFTATTELVSPEALVAKNLQLKNLRERVAVIDGQLAAIAARNAQFETLTATTATLETIQLIGDARAFEAFSKLQAQQISAAVFDQTIADLVNTDSKVMPELQLQAETLSRSITTIELEIETQSQDLLTLQQLGREARATEELYGYFLTRLKEAEVQQGTQQADARILSAAVVPRLPSKPRTMLLAGAAALAAGLVIASWLLFAEYQDRSIRSGEELEKIGGVRVMGQIPLAPVTRRDKIIGYISKNSSSPFLEAIRNLRTSLVMSNAKTPPKLFMLTSSMPGEGKTTVALALAKNFSSLGKKTLLVEADLRRRTLSEYFDAGDAKSLGQVIRSDEPITSLALFSPELGAHVILGERMADNAADFLSSVEFEKFVARARAEFDHVIFDTPPVLLVPDARVIGKYVDAILYVVKWDATVGAQVRAGVLSFTSIGLQVSGTVLSKIDPKKARRQRYGEYQSYGSYGSGYYDSR